MPTSSRRLLKSRSSHLRFSLAALLFGTLFLAATGRGNAQTFACSSYPKSGSTCSPSIPGGETYSLTNPYTVSSAMTVGGASGNVATVRVELDGVTFSEIGNYYGLAGVSFILQDPNGKKLILLGSTGQFDDSSTSGITITVADGDAQAPPTSADTTDWPSSGATSVEPTSYWEFFSGVTPVGDSSSGDWPQPDGSARLNSKFLGEPVNGTWTLYIADADPNNELVDPVAITGWKLIFTTESLLSSTTAISSNQNPSYTSSTDSAVTLTATVTSGATGTVDFTEDGTTIPGCSAQAISSGTATCNTTITAEGNHAIVATYSGDDSYSGSTSPTMYQVVENHTTSPGANEYCNTGDLTTTGETATDLVYPSYIQVPSSVTQSVANVSVVLNGLEAPGVSNDLAGAHFLLVSPGRTHNLDFLTGVGDGEQSSVNVTLQDGASLVPANTALTSTTYAPTDLQESADTFYSPSGGLTDPPSSINFSAPFGGSNADSFEQAFSTATATGNWMLFLENDSNMPIDVTGGWCIDLTLNSGTATTTAVTSSTNPQNTGQSVTFTAHVGGNPSVGTVSFTDNGNPISGGSGLAVSAGTATFSTTALTEGDHKITATYSDSPANTFDESDGYMWQRIDDATTPSASGTGASTVYSYCNTGAVQLPAAPENTGAFTPNPSNVFVANLPGTVSTVSLTLKNFETLGTYSTYEMESLISGPSGALDFFSSTGPYTEVAGEGNYTFADGNATVPESSTFGPGTYEPTSYTNHINGLADTFFSSSSGFYNVPGTFSYAQPHSGSQTFGDLYSGTNGNGTWSLFFNQLNDGDTAGAMNGWCMNFTENPVTVSATAGHSGNGQDGDFAVGEQSAAITVNVAVGDSTGPTGDPAGGNPLTVTDTLPAGLTYAGSSSGNGWSCSASGQTVTCTNDIAEAQSSSYATLTIDVNVASNAASSLTNSVSVGGAGVTGTTSNTDSITVDQAPSLSVALAQNGTFTQGQTAVWDITVSNTQTGSLTSGTVTVSDTFPTGYMLANFSGTGWTCSGTSTATCTSTAGVSGGSAFPTLALIVNVPGTSPTSVSDQATASGGGTSSPATSNTDNVTVIQAPATVAIAAGNNQSVQVGNSFGVLGVIVTDANGVAINNQSVTFAAPGSGAGGVFSSGSNTVTATTGSNGAASATFTANTVAGTYSVTATAGSASTSFTLTNTAGPPASVYVTGGSGQSAIVGQNFTAALSVMVTDTFANAVPAVAVTFTAPTSGASATLSSSGTCTTNSSGQCFVTATANTTAGGPYIVSASAGGATPASFSLTNNPPPTFVVNNTLDAGSGASDCPANPTTTGSGNCTLRDAISAADAVGGNITFDSSVFSGSITINTGKTSSPTSGQGSSLAISGQVSITGPGAGLLTIAGDDDMNMGSVVTVGSGAQVSISGLTISSGYPSSGSGGGINNQGTLTLTNCAISGNNINGGNSGAGIANSGTLTLIASTVSGNSAIPSGSGGGGGGIFSSGALTLISSTVTGNSVGFYSNGGGGGILIGGGTATIIDSTISGNSNGQLCDPGGCMGGPGGGVNVSSGTVTLSNSIVAGNTSGTNADVSGAFATASANNLIGDGTGMSGIANGSNSNQVGTSASPISPQLATGGGGPTETLIPLPGSPAICAGSAATAVANGISIDQRGVALNAGGYCPTGIIDIGSVQTDYSMIFSAPVSNVAPTSPMNPPPAITLNENSAPFTASSIPIPLSLTSSPSGAMLSDGSATTSAGVATYSGLSINEPGTGDQLTATLVLNPAIAPTAPSISATSGTFDVIAGSTPQTITFSPITGTNYALGTVPLAEFASASSPLAVTFASNSLAVCTVSGTTANLLEAGTCSITAFQPGDATYASATPVTQTFSVLAIPQTITFSTIVGAQYAQTTIAVAPSATSSLPVTLTSKTTSVCTVSGTNITLLAEGSCSLLATQPGNSQYAAAPSVARGFHVNGIQQSITFSPITGTNYEPGTVALSASATSSLPVTLTSMTTSICTVSGTSANLLASGTCTIQASQPGDTQYAAAPSVNQSFYVYANTSQPPVISPASGTTLTGSTLPIQWTAGSGNGSLFKLFVGTTGPGSSDILDGSPTTSMAANVTVPTTGATLFVRLAYQFNLVWKTEDVVYTESGTSAPPAITMPAPGTTLTSANVGFQWSPGTGPVAFKLDVGTTGPGSSNVYAGASTTTPAASVTGIPTTAAFIYVRLWYRMSGIWQFIDYVYTFSANTPAWMVSPAPGSSLGGASVTFQWNPGSATAFRLRVGTTGIGADNVDYVNLTTSTAVGFTNIPTTGGLLYVRLWYLLNGTWQYTDYRYTQAP